MCEEARIEKLERKVARIEEFLVALSKERADEHDEAVKRSEALRPHIERIREMQRQKAELRRALSAGDLLDELDELVEDMSPERQRARLEALHEKLRSQRRRMSELEAKLEQPPAERE